MNSKQFGFCTVFTTKPVAQNSTFGIDIGFKGANSGLAKICQAW